MSGSFQLESECTAGPTRRNGQMKKEQNCPPKLGGRRDREAYPERGGSRRGALMNGLFGTTPALRATQYLLMAAPCRACVRSARDSGGEFLKPVQPPRSHSRVEA